MNAIGRLCNDVESWVGWRNVSIKAAQRLEGVTRAWNIGHVCDCVTND